MCNKDKPWLNDQCRYPFGIRQEAHLQWTHDRFRVNWEEFVTSQLRANDNETCPEANRQLSLPCSEGICHFLRLLVRVVDWCVCLLLRLICCWIILTAISPGRLLICHSLAIHLLVLPPLSREVRLLLLDLDPYGGIDPFGIFPVFLKRTADVINQSINLISPSRA